MENIYPELIIECDGFTNGDTFPIKYTHRGEEQSPEFHLKNLSVNAKSITIIFDDLQAMNHWNIWNIPPLDIIPGNLPGDKDLAILGNAKQRTKYRGPNPPKGVEHKYQFSFFVLDCELKVGGNANKQQLIKAMQGHIVQYGFLCGFFE